MLLCNGVNYPCFFVKELLVIKYIVAKSCMIKRVRQVFYHLKQKKFLNFKKKPNRVQNSKVIIALPKSVMNSTWKNDLGINTRFDQLSTEVDFCIVMRGQEFSIFLSLSLR